MPFDPATIALQRDLLAKTSRQLDSDRRELARLPKNSRSKMAERLRPRVATNTAIVRDLAALIRSVEPAADVPVLDERAQWIADGRAVLDLLEANPNLPLNLATGLSISYHPMPGRDADDADKKAAVDAVAEQLGVEVTPSGPSSHYEAEILLGSARYGAVAVLSDYLARYDAVRSLGEAALAELDELEAAKAEVVR